MASHRDADREDRPGAGPWEELAPGVVRCRLPGWDATAGAVRGKAGVLVVDTGSGVAEGAEIREGLHRLFGLPVTHAALTHSHFDHVFGTASFEGAHVYGAQGLGGYLADAREELRQDAVRHGMAADVAAEAAERLVPPGHGVSEQLTMVPGEREVRLVNMGPAHSAFDLAVVVGGRDGGPPIVFCGDLVEESGEPQAGPDASPARWPAALDRLLALGGEDALYVPGHGAVVGAGFVRAQREALAERFGLSST
ncbi:MBL fold metallo-hydrolase [Streptomyces sp. WMMB 322]|uniref:MBL fold metallo-hydrolase n=1 Tax=Streptomyces sp. WMMB 322 TaxID=1286821 RepID=UPI0006E46A76|nr:MBL fold metallo-hydrolase [Streptomyces sp. WMMB 322]SCK39589.1 Glyoxylase, beta-lactamase superfamily II [Streptomyces sp. WMMB 322]